MLLILGPWGLGHSTIVLVWNVALAIEEFFAFWPREHGCRSGRPAWGLREKAVGLPMAAIASVMPMAARTGLFDSWPSHALYASHCERSSILIDPSGDVEALPEALRVACDRDSPQGVWTLNPS